MRSRCRSLVADPCYRSHVEGDGLTAHRPGRADPRRYLNPARAAVSDAVADMIAALD